MQPNEPLAISRLQCARQQTEHLLLDYCIARIYKNKRNTLTIDNEAITTIITSMRRDRLQAEEKFVFKQLLAAEMALKAMQFIALFMCKPFATNVMLLYFFLACA